MTNGGFLEPKARAVSDFGHYRSGTQAPLVYAFYTATGFN